MKIFRNTTKWLLKKLETLTDFRYKVKTVEDFPGNIKPDTVYIVADGPSPDTLVFKCPCGCKQDIYLNLLKDARPNWSFQLDKKGRITIYPSIWRKIGCKSHFLIRKGKINWV